MPRLFSGMDPANLVTVFRVLQVRQFQGALGHAPRENFEILDARKCSFLHFQKTFHENMEVPLFLKLYHFSITYVFQLIYCTNLGGHNFPRIVFHKSFLQHKGCKTDLWSTSPKVSSQIAVPYSQVQVDLVPKLSKRCIPVLQNLELIQN